jgi:CheY-like chemotaxis protein
MGLDNRNIGLLEAADRFEGEFTLEDEALLMQLAQMASFAIENVRLLEELRTADRRKDESLGTCVAEMRRRLAALSNEVRTIAEQRGDAEAVGRSCSNVEQQLAEVERWMDDLPIAPSGDRADEESPGESKPCAPGGRRILVVDDNRDAARSLAKQLVRLGNVTRTAYDGLEAVEVAERFRPEAILLDLGMPKLNGYDAARRIREQPWGEGVLLLALTGWGQEDDKRRSKEAGFDHHVTKPVDVDAMMRLIGEHAPSTA